MSTDCNGNRHEVRQKLHLHTSVSILECSTLTMCTNLDMRITALHFLKVTAVLLLLLLPSSFFFFYYYLGWFFLFVYLIVVVLNSFWAENNHLHLATHITNMVFAEGVKCPLLHTLLLNCFECVDRKLHFCILLSVNVFYTFMHCKP